MTTIPQVAYAMRKILTTTADDGVRTTRFVQRPSRLGGPHAASRWGLAFWAIRRPLWRHWRNQRLP